MISYTLVRSRRKTVAIHITKDVAVEVRAPLKTSRANIDRFVASKEKWITSHLALRKQRNSEKAAFALDYGDTVSLCGGSFPLRAGDGGRAGFDGECFYLPPGLPPDRLKNAVVLIYKAMAKWFLTKKVAAYAAQIGVTPAAVKVSGAKTRWGSCSGKNRLSFSWRLLMADEDAIDYVVVHELAHIKEHNHSPRFWAVVEGALPDYLKRRQKLTALQDRLSREDWE